MTPSEIKDATRAIDGREVSEITAAALDLPDFLTSASSA